MFCFEDGKFSARDGLGEEMYLVQLLLLEMLGDC
jgi:hypothetical protein